jgi:dTMP kinase
MFICLEGIDGAGKSTQAARLFEHFKSLGRQVELVADPGTTQIGKAIRQILLDTDAPISTHAQMLLFSAARAELSQYIQNKLSAGYTIVCDRWLLSTLVYQVALNNVDETLVYDIFEKTSIFPDVCILLDIDPATADLRKQNDARKDRYERITLAEKQMMRQAYLNYADRLAHQPPQPVFAVIPAAQEAEIVTAKIIDIATITEENACKRSIARRQLF